MADLTPEQFQRKLIVNRTKIPSLIRKVMNSTAILVRKIAQEDLDAKFILRNKFTKRSILFNLAKSNTNIFSETGSTLAYMKTQEEGGIVSAKRTRLPIPTPDARTAKNPRKLVSRRFNLSRLGSLKGRAGKRKPFLGNFKRKGVYIRNRGKVRLLFNLNQSSVKIQKRPWLKPATDKFASQQALEKRFISFAKNTFK